jgi:hypothetical protein
MNVDRNLIDAAERLLREHFPHGPGQACAAYSSQGRIFTGISMVAEDLTIEPEMALLAETQKNGALIAALVTLAWEGPGSPVVVRPPTAVILEHLQRQIRRHAQIAVSGSIGGTIKVRATWELIRELSPESYPNSAITAGRFGGGMKSLACELAKFARDVGVQRACVDFPQMLIASLKHENIRQSASSVRLPGSKFLTPTDLESVSLRHIWLAFELASETFTFDLIDSFRPKLANLGCNEADVVHIKQGLEALLHVFSALLVLTGSRRPVLNECPFYPYDSFRLQQGIPIHHYIQFQPLKGTPVENAAARNDAVVRQLIGVLAERGDGGFTSYLAQRALFKLDIFSGGGAGSCPFAPLSNEIISATAIALRRALDERIVILAPDRPSA